MTRLKLFFTVLGCLPIIVFAASQGKVQGTVESFDDYVMIRYMPSRVEFLRSEPVTELKSESHTTVVIRDGRVMKTNNFIKKFFERAREIEAKGVVSNQQFFHVRFRKIEISYRGETVTLEYADSSAAEEYEQYEADWVTLYDDVYQFLLKDLEPSQVESKRD